MNIYCFSTLSFAKLQFKSVINKAFHKHGVASFTDAWIETLLPFYIAKKGMSHLLQMRGLKHYILKNRRVLDCVASFTDAWIETFAPISYPSVLLVASFTDAWIETLHLLKRLWKRKVASFTDAWIETLWNLPTPKNT